MSRARSLIADQHLYLKLLIMLMALAGNLDASLRQIVMQVALFLLFFLLDISFYSSLLSALRKVLPFFAGYWLFAALLDTPFPQMVLFSLKLLLFVQVSVYVFARQDIRYVLEDTVRLRRHGWGNTLVYYTLATALFIRAYSRYFARHRLQAGSSIGQVLDVVAGGARQSLGAAKVIDRQISAGFKATQMPDSSRAGSGLIGLCLLTLMVVINSI